MLAVKSHLFLAAVLTLHIMLLAGFVMFRARHVRPLGRLGCGALWCSLFASRTWRRHMDREVRGAGLGGRLDFHATDTRPGGRLAANAHHHGPRGDRLADSGDFGRDRALCRSGCLVDSLSMQPVVRRELGAAV